MTPAFAETATAVQSQQASMISSFVMIAVMIAVFYFFIIRPQRKKQKQLQEMLNSMKKGDRVVTIGGFYGEIVEFKGNDVIIDIAPNTRVKMLKSAIASRAYDQEEEQK